MTFSEVMRAFLLGAFLGTCGLSGVLAEDPDGKAPARPQPSITKFLREPIPVPDSKFLGLTKEEALALIPTKSRIKIAEKNQMRISAGGRRRMGGDMIMERQFTLHLKEGKVAKVTLQDRAVGVVCRRLRR